MEASHWAVSYLILLLLLLLNIFIYPDTFHQLNVVSYLSIDKFGSGVVRVTDAGDGDTHVFVLKPAQPGTE